MIRISQIKLEVNKWDGLEPGSEAYGERELLLLREAARRVLRIKEEALLSLVIVKKSIDARKKEDIRCIYTVDAEVAGEDGAVRRRQNGSVSRAEQNGYRFPAAGHKSLGSPPVIAGSGPAGLFCGLLLAEQGYCPIILERGGNMEERAARVEAFWKTGKLDAECNVQFGEGGAGTFSDGKLNTTVRDISGRNRLVLEIFVKYGGPAELLYLHKPHIGTDRLKDIVVAMRRRILSLGGQVLFYSKLTDIKEEGGRLRKIVINDSGEMDCEVLVLAVGHSARDTFSMLDKRGLFMSRKPFALGVRMEHPQAWIQKSQYGSAAGKLPPADYKLTHPAANGRGVYSFCMCPGGFVVNASSEPGCLAVNGMSNYKRDGRNANSAIVVSVVPEDFEGESPLAGVEFQRKWEGLAFGLAGGKVPVQTYEDFKADKKGALGLGAVCPDVKGSYQPADLRKCLPDFVTEAILEAIPAFDKKIRGFADGSAVLSGVETRTSSPVRLKRDEALESNIRGIFPCGEGAGYAGGITSAAMDGIQVFEAIRAVYAPRGERGRKT